MSPFYTKDNKESFKKIAFHILLHSLKQVQISLIDYHLNFTHFGETCQQGLQEGVLKKKG
jgi:hypothetical protein